MSKKIFLLFLGIILLFAFFIRILPARNNNFYFTIDQGDEAVKARELWFRHKLPLIGQGTSLPGIYHGPFWIWYISIGYALFDGHPFGALFMLIILKLAVTAFLIWRLAHHTSRFFALFTGISLQLFWPFYDASRFAFSPFPLISIATVTLILLTESLEGKRWEFIAAALPVGMIIHTELASFPPFFALCIIVGLWGIFKKKLGLKEIFLYLTVLSLFFLPHLISETTSNFPQWSALKRQTLSEGHVFSMRRAGLITKVFIDSVEESVAPLKPFMFIGTIFVPLLFLYVKTHRYFLKNSNRLLPKHIFTDRYITITLLLFFLSWLWFNGTSGWNPWHTVYIPPTIFIAVLLAIWNLPQKLRFLLFSIIITAQIIAFARLYNTFFNSSNDASLLTNELAAINWTYQKAQGEGFYVYSYLPSVNDYPYQYLFWWWGRKKYDYVPCEYSTYPNTPSLFVPGLNNYQEPKRPCGNKRFLIIEPDKNTAVQDVWLKNIRDKTSLVNKTKVGNIQVEERIFYPDLII